LYNIINGTLPAIIGSFPELWQLEFVNQPGLTGPIPPEIGQLPKLKWLFFDNTSISGNLPCELFDIPTLEDLRIKSPNITGPMPPCICNAPVLRSLYILDTRMYGNFPDCITQMDSLEIIYMDNNKSFGGVLSDSLCNMNKLHMMTLSNNNFSGDIPTCFNNHSKWATLFFTNEKFSGTFPIATYNHPGSFSANLKNCEFTDLATPIPSPYGQDIEYYSVSNNKLTFGTFENFYFYSGNNTIEWSMIFELVPQDSVWSPLDTTVLPGSSITFESYVSGQYNAYMWYKDTTYLGWNTTGLWTIHNASAADSGTYYCRIYNQYITPDRGLMLYRHHIRLHVDTTVNVQSGAAYQEPHVFPVPFGNELNINLNKLAGNFTAITLYNSAGIPVFTCETRKHYRIIETEKLPAGLYFLKLQQGDKVYTYKVVKE
jgi:hypothetical protein